MAFGRFICVLDRCFSLDSLPKAGKQNALLASLNGHGSRARFVG
jgi:hypothetical protein